MGGLIFFKVCDKNFTYFRESKRFPTKNLEGGGEKI